ncbi:MAG TPA: hypothetical protein VNN25_22960 [Thermoanaerobaculia bacterium]|nr:hypothetical protein [Thermoanaerobaculia bacterium]
MPDLTKSQKRAVGELLGDAHEAEIASALVKVEQAIKEWRSGAILPSEVSERIHEFHKESQQIFKTYNNLDLMFALARAVAFGFVELARVPEDLQPRIKELEALVKGDDG